MLEETIEKQNDLENWRSHQEKKCNSLTRTNGVLHTSRDNQVQKYRMGITHLGNQTAKAGLEMKMDPN